MWITVSCKDSRSCRRCTDRGNAVLVPPEVNRQGLGPLCGLPSGRVRLVARIRSPVAGAGLPSRTSPYDSIAFCSIRIRLARVRSRPRLRPLNRPNYRNCRGSRDGGHDDIVTAVAGRVSPQERERGSRHMSYPYGPQGGPPPGGYQAPYPVHPGQPYPSPYAPMPGGLSARFSLRWAKIRTAE